MPMSTIDITHMTVEERLELIGELWDSLTDDDVTLTPAQDAELDYRLARFDTDRTTAVSFDEVEAKLDRRSR